MCYVPYRPSPTSARPFPATYCSSTTVSACAPTSTARGSSSRQCSTGAMRLRRPASRAAARSSTSPFRSGAESSKVIGDLMRLNLSDGHSTFCGGSYRIGEDSDTWTRYDKSVEVLGMSFSRYGAARAEVYPDGIPATKRLVIPPTSPSTRLTRCRRTWTTTSWPPRPRTATPWAPAPTRSRRSHARKAREERGA